MKKFFIFVMIISLFFTTACSINGNKHAGTIVKPSLEGSKPVITILVSNGDEGLLKTTVMKSYISKFEQDYGVEVELQSIGSSHSVYYIGNQLLVNEAVDEYKKELSVKLHQKDGAELIFYSVIPLNSLIRQGVAENVRDKISNLDKLHPGLVNEEVYYVPFEIFHMPIVLNIDALEAMQIDKPSLAWTKQDYLAIRDKWLQQTKQQFTSKDFLDITAKHLIDLEIFNEDKSKVKINSADMYNAINSIKEEIYNGSYILPQSYEYKNYYNMLFEKQLAEYNKDRSLLASKEYSINNFRNSEQESDINALRAGDSNYMFQEDNVVLPNVLENKKYLFSDGFMINKNGKNKELAYEFVNGILDNEVQLELFMDSMFSYYPVNNEIEKDISVIEKNSKYVAEAIELKKYMLNEIEKGNATLSIARDDREYEIFWMLVKDLTKYIFTDNAYTELELKQELQKLEDKYNIWLSE